MIQSLKSSIRNGKDMTVKKKRVFVGAYIAIETAEAIKATAKAEGRPVSDTVRRLLDLAVKKAQA